MISKDTSTYTETNGTKYWDPTKDKETSLEIDKIPDNVRSQYNFMKQNLHFSFHETKFY